MSSRPPWRDIVALGIAALALRVAASALVPDPAYLDAAYYELVARQLAGGDGFSVPVVWSFLETGGVLPSDPVLPVASNRHWMPLTSVVSAGSMAIFGTSRIAAELPHAILGALLVPATAWIGWWLWSSRAVAVVAGVLALFAGPMLVYVPMVDSFALFGAFGLVALLAAVHASGPRRSGAWLVLSGVAAALAMLTRIDGVLLGIAPATVWLARRGWGPWSVTGPPISGWWAVATMVAAAAVVAPWFARQASEFGSILPSAGGRLLWITSFNEQFSITDDPTLSSYLDQGLPAIVKGKLESLVQVLGRTTVLLGGAFVAPFVFGLWRERRRPDLAPFAAYWLVLLAAMVLVFTFHAPAGAYYHSAWAWLPVACPLAVANAAPMLQSFGRRIPMLRRPRNVRFLAGAALGGAVILSLIGSAALLAQWGRDRANVGRAAEFLAERAGADDVIMYVNPPLLNLLTGLQVIAPPFDAPQVISRVARAYRVRWVVVERTAGAEHDALLLWDGRDWLADEPALDAGDVRIFATDQ